MRPLEILLTVVLLPYIIHLLSLSRGESLAFDVLPIIGALIVIGHLVTEGYRWQMLPAYCLAAIFVTYELARWLFDFRVSHQTTYYAGLAALIFEFATIGLGTALPIFKLPAPTGPYAIATDIRHLVDRSRQDKFADRPDGPRELMIQIWYPSANAARSPIAPYVDKRITSLWNSRLALVKTHAHLRSQFSSSKSKYPLLLYTPSWVGLRTECTIQVEELASHGYIVVTIDHPFSSSVTIFPDGRIARRKFSGEEDYSSQAGFERFLRTADEQVEIRSRDARFVLDSLETMDANDPSGLLTGHIDLESVGIFGSSFGGTTAAETCWLDQRFKAGASLDGMVAGTSSERGTRVPFLFMLEGDDPTQTPETALGQLEPARRRQIEFTRDQFARIKASLSEYGGYWMTIQRANHSNFFDFPFFSPLKQTNVDPRMISRIIGQYLLAFFEKHLNGIEQPALENSKERPETNIQVWSPNAPVRRTVR
jgi:predicted dienelactone hydrolase